MGKRERFRLSVSVFAVLRREDQVLLIRRANTGWLDGLFSVPAGAMDGDEPAALAVIREASEEASVSIDPDNIRLAHTLHCRTEGDEWLGLFFEVFAWDGTPKIGEPDKHSDLTWAPISALPNDLVPYVRQALTCISSDIAYSAYGW
ncbi:NUDIX hydrolase [Parvibaculum sedimenti]|nr:NUDIX domain-containing protein [Parvibaculum sedimenti]